MNDTSLATDLGPVPSLPGLDPHSSARDEVRRILVVESQPMTWAAKEAGISYPTFNAWVNGNYAGNNDNVLERTRVWLDSRQAKRALRAVLPKAPDFIETSTSERIKATLEHAQHAPAFAVITGLPGVGKTIAAQDYQKHAPSVWLVTCEPCITSTRTMLDLILEDGFGVHEKFGFTRAISAAIVKRMRNSGGLLIIDEAQSLPSMALDQLRTLSDRSQTGIVLMGNPMIYSRLEGDGRQAQFAQLFSRVGMRLDRKKVPPRDVDILLDAWRVAGAAERRLIHAIVRKPGALRNMRFVMRLSWMRAQSEGRDSVQVADISSAWGQISDTTITEEAA